MLCEEKYSEKDICPVYARVNQNQLYLFQQVCAVTNSVPRVESVFVLGENSADYFGLNLLQISQKVVLIAAVMAKLMAREKASA